MTSKVKRNKTPQRNDLISNAKLILLLSWMKYPRIPAYTFPTYMLLKYIKLAKTRQYFKTTPVPDELLHFLIKNKPLVDLNNCVIVNRNYARAILNNSEYVILNDGEGKKRIVCMYGGDVKDGEVLVSHVLSHNLHGNRFRISPIELTEIQIADEFQLCLNTTLQNVPQAAIELLLKNYFKNPKLVYKNDLIAITLREHAPDYFYTSVKCNEVDRLYFKCVNIAAGPVEDCVNGYFCVMGATALKQGPDTQCFLPAAEKIVKDGITRNVSGAYEDMLVDSCPDGLKQYVEILERGIRPFLNHKNLKLNPMFFMQSPKGSGKRLVVNTLASRLGLKLCRLSSGELSAHAYGQAEIKIRNAFFRCKLCAPCIVIIENFENFCKNNEGQHDPRIINYFKTELSTLFKNNENPIILLCTSNATELPSEMGRMFLENITVEAPRQPDREHLLKWILRKRNFECKANLSEVAGKTHGFLYEDLDALVYYAKRNALTVMNKTDYQLEDTDFEAALDVMQSNYTESLGAPKVPKVQWSDVGGLEDVKHEIIKTINLPLKHPELLKSGLKRSGVLLYGPPGTGKTLIAKAVATECGLCFLSVKGPELLNMYVGQSEQNIREVFEKARQASPCIIFFDELDSLAPNRGISGDSGGVMDRVVSQLLSEMDGLNQNATLFVIGATNRPDLIDPALLRPGRFDKLLYIGPCTDISSKVSVLNALLRKFQLSDKLSIERIVKICPENITGADFYGICSNAWMIAAGRLVRKIESGKLSKNEITNHKDVVVTFKDFEESIKAAKPSISSEDLVYFEKLRKQLSVK